MPDPSLSSQSTPEKEPVWMVARTNPFAEHWSTPKNTYGPFESREAADEFAKDGGWVYDWNREPHL